MSEAERPLVHLRRNRGGTNVTPAHFSESVLEELRNKYNSGADPVNEIFVEYEMTDDALVLESSTYWKDEGILLRRPPFCPIMAMDPQLRDDLPDESKSRGVNIGVSILLESSDNCILITRRSKSMRTFPQVWVPPGGHLDHGENLVQAGLRELQEETGISLDDNVRCKMLGFWESAFPPILKMGIPRRHHVVAYLHSKVEETAAEINQKINLDTSETDACAWLCQCLAREIVHTDWQFKDHSEQKIKCCSANNVCGFEKDKIMGILAGENITTGDVIQTAPLFSDVEDSLDRERVSTGTKYAMKLWLTAQHLTSQS